MAAPPAIVGFLVKHERYLREIPRDDGDEALVDTDCRVDCGEEMADLTGHTRGAWNQVGGYLGTR